MIINFSDVLFTWKNRLTSYVLNMYDVSGLPVELNETYFKKVSLNNAAVFRTVDNRLVALPYTIRNTPNYDYTPKEILCENPYLLGGKTTYNLTVNINAELIYYYPTDVYLFDGKNINSTIKQYINDTAAQLAIIDISIAVCAENMRFNVAIVAGDDNDMISLQDALKKFKTGDIPVLTSTELISNGVRSIDLTGKRDIKLSELTELKQNIISAFLQSIGYSVQNNFKREYVHSGELERNDILADISADVIFGTLNKCVDNINALFNTNIKITKKNIKTKYVDTDTVKQYINSFYGGGFVERRGEKNATE